MSIPAGSFLGNVTPCEAMKLQSVLLDWQLSSLLRPELEEASSLLALETSLELRCRIGSGSSYVQGRNTPVPFVGGACWQAWVFVLECQLAPVQCVSLVFMSVKVCLLSAASIMRLSASCPRGDTDLRHAPSANAHNLIWQVAIT